MKKGRGWGVFTMILSRIQSRASSDVFANATIRDLVTCDL